MTKTEMGSQSFLANALAITKHGDELRVEAAPHPKFLQAIDAMRAFLANHPSVELKMSDPEWQNFIHRRGWWADGGRSYGGGSGDGGTTAGRHCQVRQSFPGGAIDCVGDAGCTLRSRSDGGKTTYWCE